MDLDAFGQSIMRGPPSTNVKDEQNYPDWYKDIRHVAGLAYEDMFGGMPAIQDRYRGMVIPQPEVILGPPDNMREIIDETRDPIEIARVRDAMKESLLRRDGQTPLPDDAINERNALLREMTKYQGR